MTQTDSSRLAFDEQLVLDAAIEELATTSAGMVTVAAVAKRAGVAVEDVRRTWPNQPELLTAALMHYGQRRLSIPDTGSLRGDLLGYARRFAEEMNSPAGRRLLDALLVTPKDWDVTGWRTAFVAARNALIAAALQRSVDRGELRPDVDPVGVVDLLLAGLRVPLHLYDRPISDADCVFVVDTLLNGVRPKG